MVFVLIADQQLDAEDSDIVILGRAGHEALASIGGKAANLGELVRAGFRVPCGFTVTTRAYAEAAHAAKVEPLVDALARTPINDKPRLASLAAEIRFAIASTPLNGRLARAIVDAYHTLGDGLAVAVRSSATAEDLAAASSAGQQDTFLNVRGGDALLDAVRECWASLWTERAVIYRATASIDQRQVRLAVIAQKMIHAVAAGVLFTANPLTGRRRQAVIEVSPGLGEEQWKDDLTKIWARSRILLLAAGEELAAAGQLEAAEHIFFVTLPEVRAALGSRTQAAFVKAALRLRPSSKRAGIGS
jgi:pyruvate,water dikinase